MTNLEITGAAAPHGLYYAPDPSSQQVCTIGGNVAENSGGAHCLKYGFTTNHVLVRARWCWPTARWSRSARDTGEQPGPDLRGVFLGSEGTLGITTKITVRLLRTPESVRTLLADFPSVAAAGDVVSDIVAAGIVPAAVEMMDTLAIEAAEEAVHAGYTLGVAAALVVELDGPAEECDDPVRAGQGRSASEHGCTRLHIAGSPRSGRRSGAGARRRSPRSAGSRPDYFVQDGVVPRTRLAEVLARIAEMGDEAGLRVANVFHAGDGNLHPLVLYSAAAGRDRARPSSCPAQIAELCVELGGSLSGEHGIGTDKACSMPKMFGEDDLAVMAPGARGLRPGRAVQPGQGAAHAAAVRRAARASTGRTRWRRPG